MGALAAGTLAFLIFEMIKERNLQARIRVLEGEGATLLATITDLTSETLIVSEQTVSQNIASGTFTPVQFDTDLRNVGFNTDRTTDTSVFIAPEDGDYLVIYGLEWSAAGGNGRESAIVLNGNLASIESAEYQASSSDTTDSTGSWIVSCVAGDTIAIWVFQLSGGTVQLRGSDPFHRCLVHIRRLHH